MRTDGCLCDGRRARRAEYGASRFAFRSWPLGRTLTRDDAVIVAGDFGFVWDGSNAEKYWLDWFESKPWTTCFVDGNHENHHALAGLPVREWNSGLVHEARPHVLHLMRGEVFDIDGLTVLAMGGAASNDRQYRREGRSWWPEEMPSEEEIEHCRSSLDRVGWKVDHVVTHEAPAALAEKLCRERGREYRCDRLQRFLGELDGGSATEPGSSATTTATSGVTTGIALSTEISCRSKMLRPGSRNLLEAL